MTDNTDFFTVTPLQKYLDLTNTFADKVAEGLHDPIFILFGSLGALWIVISGIKLALQMTDVARVVQEFFYISIASILVGSQGIPLIQWVYSSALSIMAGGADVAFSIAFAGEPQSVPYTGLPRLAAYGEKSAETVIHVAQMLMQRFSLYNALNGFYALILVVPYFLFVVSYVSQVIVAIFRVTMIAIFAPFLSLAFAFNCTRPMFSAGCKTLLGSILVLFAATCALALTIYGVQQVPIGMEETTDLDEFASFSNAKFVMILFLGWIGTALMTEGTSLANSIAGTMLTNAAAGIMAAGAGATAAAALKYGRKAAGVGGNMLGKLGDFSRENIWQRSGENVQNLVDQFKDKK